MNNENTKKLYERYPEIFAGANASIMESAMAWGFCHGDGWYDIIESLCRNIMGYVNSHNSNLRYSQSRGKRLDEKPMPIPVASQVKEKFGTLRFYIDSCDPYIYGLIAMAESMSSVICEICGSKAQTRNDRGWMSTLCDGCCVRLKIPVEEDEGDDEEDSNNEPTQETKDDA
jgi:hypothetical protein